MSLKEQPAVLPDPVNHLLRLLQTGGARRTVVGLVGLPGSGKSTVAARLADEVNAQAGAGTMVALGMDGFHLSKAALAQFPDPAAALQRRGSPWTFDPAALAARLQRLRQTSPAKAAPPVMWPGFEHGVGDPVEDAVAIAPSVRLVLLEGLYLLHRSDGWDLSGLMDECWYLDVPMDMAMARLADRHMATWGLTRSEAVARIAVNDQLNALTVQASRPLADWCVAN
jgi:pantothenate kinase